MNFFGEDHGRPGALWRLLIQFVLFQVLAVFLTTPLALAWSLFTPGGTALGGVEISGGRQAGFLIGVVASMAAALFSVWLAGRLDRRPFRDFGFHLDGGWWLNFLFGLILGSALMTGIFFIELAFDWVTVTGSFRPTPGAPFATSIILPLIAFLFVGIYEELVFRGYQLRNMAEGFNHPALGPRVAVLTAWAFSSVLFGVLHALSPNAGVVSTVNITLAGLMLGTGYVLTGELAVPIGLHVSWNFFEGNVFGFPVSGKRPLDATFISTKQAGPEIWTGGVFGPEGGLLVTFAAIAGILLTVLWVRLRSGRISVHTPLAEYPKRGSATVQEK